MDAVLEWQAFVVRYQNIEPTVYCVEKRSVSKAVKTLIFHSPNVVISE